MPRSKCLSFEELPAKEGVKYPMKKVTFEDGTSELTRSKFEVGREYEYIVETREGKTSGKPYKYIVKPESDYKGSPQGAYKRDPLPKVISMGMSYCVDLYLSDPIVNLKGVDLKVIEEAIIPNMINNLRSLEVKSPEDYVTTAMSYVCNRVYRNETVMLKMRAAKGVKREDTNLATEMDIILLLYAKMLQLMVKREKNATV